MKKQASKMSRAISQIEHMYSAINTDFWDGELPTPVITVQSAPGTAGHCTRAKVWQRKDGGAYELNISAEALNQPVEEVIDTIIHEMVHLYCRENGVQEVSRNGSYHNKNFKAIAEAHGLKCYRTEKYGWNTTPTDALVAYALQKGWSEISLGRDTLPKPITAPGQTAGTAAQSGTRTSSTRKLACPICKQSVRATRHVNILCGDCMVKMLEV
ncbi:MAG: SprT-like domain-containing protein [Oscillospiraceae bacterium]|nr:SprT-like domain-containing protein [Oscillospiraceae bacterium]